MSIYKMSQHAKVSYAHIELVCVGAGGNFPRDMSNKIFFSFYISCLVKDKGKRIVISRNKYKAYKINR